MELCLKGAVPVIFLDGKSHEKYVFLKLYEGRVEGCYSLYSLSSVRGDARASKLPGVFGAPMLDENGFLVSTTHDGPFAKIEKYRMGSGMRKVKPIIPTNSDVERVIVYSEKGPASSTRIELLGTSVEACVTVTDNRAHISSEPKADGGDKPYLIEGMWRRFWMSQKTSVG